MVTFPLSEIIDVCPVCDKPVIEHIEYHNTVCKPRIRQRILDELARMASEDWSSERWVYETDEYRPEHSM